MLFFSGTLDLDLVHGRSVTLDEELKNQRDTLQGRITYPTLGKGKSSSKCIFLGGYVSSLEGISFW